VIVVVKDVVVIYFVDDDRVAVLLATNIRPRRILPILRNSTFVDLPTLFLFVHDSTTETCFSLPAWKIGTAAAALLDGSDSLC
jgi:hypothetical protein